MNSPTPFYENLPPLDRPYSDPPLKIAKADRKPCPVCGHPTGDCTADYDGPRHIIGVPDKEHLVYVKEDVTQEVILASGAKTTVILARGGSYITKAKAKEFGIS
jgi:hypothetical protein